STLFTGLSVLKQGTFTALSLITQRGRNGEKVNGEATWFGDQNKERLGLSLEIAKQAMKDITTSFKDLNEARTALQQGNEMDSKCFETPASTRDSVLSQDKTVVTSIASPALRNPEPGTPEIAAQTAQSTQQPSNQSLGNGRRPTEAPPPPPPRNNGLANMEANTPPGLPTSAPATPTTGRQAQQATVPGM
ncbi:MAG: hypothetical protein OEY79_03335, partial [Anaplasmataceae bacterium]|nr:hypothetical protein [Anaplasmataceae bacterium]